MHVESLVVDENKGSSASYHKRVENTDSGRQIAGVLMACGNCLIIVFMFFS